MTRSLLPSHVGFADTLCRYEANLMRLETSSPTPPVASHDADRARACLATISNTAGTLGLLCLFEESRLEARGSNQRGPPYTLTYRFLECSGLNHACDRPTRPPHHQDAPRHISWGRGFCGETAGPASCRQRQRLPKEKVLACVLDGPRAGCRRACSGARVSVAQLDHRGSHRLANLCPAAPHTWRCRAAVANKRCFNPYDRGSRTVSMPR